MWLFSFLFGDPSNKKLKQYQKELEQIKWIEVKFREEISTIDQVQAKTHELQSRFEWLDIENSEDKQKIRDILESIKYETFALHRRACELIYGQSFDLGGGKSITWNMIPYDVQLIWALALHEGNIAEMRTWEGKHSLQPFQHFSMPFVVTQFISLRWMITSHTVMP